MVPLFNPTLEVSIRGQNVRDLLYQIIGSLSVALDTGHQSVSISINSSYAFHAINTWCDSWKIDARRDGIWRDSSGKPIIYQPLLETILGFKNKLEMQVFLCEPVIDVTE